MKKYRILFIAMISFLGGISFINNSGFAGTIDSNNRTAYLIFGIAAYIVLSAMRHTKSTSKRKAVFILAMVSAFWIRSYIAGYGIDGFRFLMYFVSIFVISKLCFDEVNLVYMCLIYGVLTSVILFSSNFGSILKGWNPNSIAIQSFQMLSVFCIGFNTDFKSIRLRNGVWAARFRMLIFWGLILYATSLMESLDCRSASLSCIITAVLMLKSEWAEVVLRNKRLLFVLVIAPCIIAFTVIYLSKMPVADTLNTWSIQHFKKPIFNGRDNIWEYGIQRFFYKNPLFGRGNVNYGNWHNNAVGCLASFGLFGYCLYAGVFYNILAKASNYLSDVFVRKGVIVFLIVNFQQSFENTICQSKLMIMHPYLILGIILGRIAYLEYESKYNNTGIQYR